MELNRGLGIDDIALDIPLGRIAALRAGGEGATRVLALHGWLDNAASFVPLARHLDGLDLVAVDLPGHGRSAHLAVGADYSFYGSVNVVLDIADALGWDRFALLGHSMGAGIGSLVAATSTRVTRLLAIEALGALAETPGRTAIRMREAVAAARALPKKSLRVFPVLEPAIRARMQANALSEPVARLLVERGVREVEGGYVWSSDPRLTLPSFTRLTEAQVIDLVAGIECPVRVIHADPAQPYCPIRCGARTPPHCATASWSSSAAAITCTWSSRPKSPRRSGISSSPDRRAAQGESQADASARSMAFSRRPSAWK